MFFRKKRIKSGGKSWKWYFKICKFSCCKVPTNWFEFQKAKYSQLNYNQIDEISESIRNFPNLKNFFISNNQIKTIDEILDFLAKINIVDLSNNLICNLPPNFRNTKSKKILITKNELEKIEYRSRKNKFNPIKYYLDLKEKNKLKGIQEENSSDSEKNTIQE